MDLICRDLNGALKVLLKVTPSFVEKAHNSVQRAPHCSRRCFQGDLSRHKEKSFAPSFHAFNLMEFERYRKFKWNFLIKLHRPGDSLVSNTVSIFTDS